MNFNVLVHYHPMVGVDFHKAQAPGPVPPVPFSPHIVAAALYLGPWGILTGSPAPTVKSSFGITMQKCTDIGPLVPHVCVTIPPNLLTPIYIIGSASKSYFGAASVKVGGSPVAVAVAVVVNMNVDCGDISTPTGIVIAPNTVTAGMTWGDLFAGLIQALIEGALQYAIGKAVGALGDAIAGKIFSATVGAAEAAMKAGASDVAGQFAAEMAKGGVGTILGLAAGSPLGASGSNILKALGIYDGPKDPNDPNWSSPVGAAAGALGGAAGTAAQQHIDNPSVPQYPTGGGTGGGSGGSGTGAGGGGAGGAGAPGGGGTGSGTGGNSPVPAH